MVQLRNVFPNVLCQDLVDQRLIPDTSTLRFSLNCAKTLTSRRIAMSLTWALAERWPPDAPHGAELPSRRLGNVAEVNLLSRTPCARDGSHGGR